MWHKRVACWMVVVVLAGVCDGGRVVVAQCEPEETAKLIAADGAAHDLFGSSVSISGNVALVGANGADPQGHYFGSAYIYRHNGVGWVEEQKLTASDGALNDMFGYSVSISGDVAVLGAIGDDDNGDRSGSAYVFRYDGAEWVEEQKLTASDGAAIDEFGISISISGDVAVVGTRYDDDNGVNSGSAYVFRYDGAEWVEEQKFTASDGAEVDYFGWSVSTRPNVVIVGAYFDDDNGDRSGSAYVFRYDGAEWVEEQKLTASDGAEGDYFGYSVSINGDAAVVGAKWDDDNGTGSGSAYIFRHNGAAWVEEEKLTTSDGAASDAFGHSVSISGDVVVVGAERDDDNRTDSGSAYIFRHDGAAWVEDAKLTASDAAEGDKFGYSASISGDVAVVGALLVDESQEPGRAYIFDLNCCPADFNTKLTASDGAAGALFGQSISITDSVAAVGAFYDDAKGENSGSAYVYRHDGVDWLEEQKLTAWDGAESDSFGVCVSISGDVLLIGAEGDDDNGDRSGSAYVFRYDGAGWVEEQKLTASDGEEADRLGYSVSISGDVAIVGALLDDDNGTSAGSAYVFRYDGAQWLEEQKLLASDGARHDVFGFSVSISGDAAVVGAFEDDDNGFSSGSAYVYRYDGAEWVEEQKLTASDGAASDHFAYAVSISGDVVVVGAEGDDDNRTDSGSAYIFRHDGAAWVEDAKLTASDGAEGDQFGYSVSISGVVAAVGAYADDEEGTDSGSAYVFRFDGEEWVEEQKLTAFDGAANDLFGWSVSIREGIAAVGAKWDDDNGEHSGSAYVVDLNCPSDATPVCAGSGTLVEGTGEVNDFNAACGSDDSYWAAHGSTFAYAITDPVVQFELIATAPTDFIGGPIRIGIEASKENDSGSLNILAFLFNFRTGSYDALPVVFPLSTTDIIETFGLPAGADPNDFVEPGTNDVKLLILTIQTSGLPNVRTQLDEVLFNFE